MVKEPKISVLMPVYNCIQYIRYSIESILSQTFDNFEFIIIDASDDETSEIINSYDDDRIVYFKKNYQFCYLPIGIPHIPKYMDG